MRISSLALRGATALAATALAATGLTATAAAAAPGATAPTPMFTVTPAPLDFGAQVVNTTSADKW